MEKPVRKVKDLIKTDDILLIFRVEKKAFGRVQRHWMLASKAHGEQTFRPEVSREKAVEGFTTMSGLAPKRIIRFLGVFSEAEASALAAKELYSE